MYNEEERIKEFTALVERREGVKLAPAEAKVLYLRLMNLYGLLIRKPPPAQDGTPPAGG